MKIEINAPNDYASESAMEAAIEECYGGDVEACEEQGGQEIYERLAAAAKEAGLIFVKATDFGAQWEGSKEHVEKALTLLPTWAYTSII